MNCNEIGKVQAAFGDDQPESRTRWRSARRPAGEEMIMRLFGPMPPRAFIHESSRAEHLTDSTNINNAPKPPDNSLLEHAA